MKKNLKKTNKTAKTTKTAPKSVKLTGQDKRIIDYMKNKEGRTITPMEAFSKLGCPNQPEPAICSMCDWCDEPIYEGDHYYIVQSSRYCEQCIDEDCKEIMQHHGYLNAWIAEVDR